MVLRLFLLLNIILLQFSSSTVVKNNQCSQFKRVSTAAIAALTISTTICGGTVPSFADDAWTSRNQLAAQTWKAVDEAFYDRTFNGNDWFKLRQSTVKKEYKSDEEVYTALKNMLSKLGDQYTRFLTPIQYSTILNSAKGELTGVGVELLPKDTGEVQVVQVFEDSPAQGSGLMVGDTILDVDGTDAKGLSAEEVASFMRGKKGTKASIRVSRKGDVKDYTVTREPFKLKAVSSSRENIEGKDVAVISIRSFDFSTCDNVVKALTDIKQKGPVQAIVLDLRNNGGGLLQGAVQTSNVFLPPGKTVVFVTGKDGDPKAQDTLPNGLPTQNSLVPDTRTKLYIIINANTASAAEVLAAGLKENSRAELVGEKSFGKGIIQNLQEIGQGSGVAVTVAKYETPLRNNINKIGIDVDTKVDCDSSVSAALCAEKFL